LIQIKPNVDVAHQIGQTLTESGDQRGKDESCDGRRDYHWTRIANGLGSPTWGQVFDIGQAEYRSSCATCHGIDGKGKGPASDALRVSPPDLTILAKKTTAFFRSALFMKQ
jgi:hypothetical protein